ERLLTVRTKTKTEKEELLVTSPEEEKPEEPGILGTALDVGRKGISYLPFIGIPFRDPPQEPEREPAKPLSTNPTLDSLLEFAEANDALLPFTRDENIASREPDKARARGVPEVQFSLTFTGYQDFVDHFLSTGELKLTRDNDGTIIDTADTETIGSLTPRMDVTIPLVDMSVGYFTDAARHRYMDTRLESRKQERDLLLRIAAAKVDIIWIKRLKAGLEIQKKNLEEELEQLKARNADITDIKSKESHIAKITVDLKTIDLSLELAMESFRAILGINPEDKTRLENEVTQIDTLLGKTDKELEELGDEDIETLGALLGQSERQTKKALKGITALRESLRALRTKKETELNSFGDLFTDIDEKSIQATVDQLRNAFEADSRSRIDLLKKLCTGDGLEDQREGLADLLRRDRLAFLRDQNQHLRDAISDDNDTIQNLEELFGNDGDAVTNLVEALLDIEDAGIEEEAWKKIAADRGELLLEKDVLEQLRDKIAVNPEGLTEEEKTKLSTMLDIDRAKFDRLLDRDIDKLKKMLLKLSRKKEEELKNIVMEGMKKAKEEIEVKIDKMREFLIKLFDRDNAELRTKLVGVLARPKEELEALLEKDNADFIKLFGEDNDVARDLLIKMLDKDPIVELGIKQIDERMGEAEDLLKAYKWQPWSFKVKVIAIGPDVAVVPIPPMGLLEPIHSGLENMPLLSDIPLLRNVWSIVPGAFNAITGAGKNKEIRRYNTIVTRLKLLQQAALREDAENRKKVEIKSAIELYKLRHAQLEEIDKALAHAEAEKEADKLESERAAGIVGSDREKEKHDEQYINSLKEARETVLRARYLARARLEELHITQEVALATPGREGADIVQFDEAEGMLEQNVRLRMAVLDRRIAEELVELAKVGSSVFPAEMKFGILYRNVDPYKADPYTEEELYIDNPVLFILNYSTVSKPGVKVAEEDVKIARQRIAEEMNSLLEDLLMSVGEYSLAKKKTDLASQKVRLMSVGRDRTEELHEDGSKEVDELDVARKGLDKAKQEELEARTQFEEAAESLSAFLGKNLGVEFDMSQPLSKDVIDTNLAELSRLARQANIEGHTSVAGYDARIEQCRLSSREILLNGLLGDLMGVLDWQKTEDRVIAGLEYQNRLWGANTFLRRRIKGVEMEGLLDGRAQRMLEQRSELDRLSRDVGYYSALAAVNAGASDEAAEELSGILGESYDRYVDDRTVLADPMELIKGGKDSQERYVEAYLKLVVAYARLVHKLEDLDVTVPEELRSPTPSTAFAGGGVGLIERDTQLAERGASDISALSEVQQKLRELGEADEAKIKAIGENESLKELATLVGVPITDQNFIARLTEKLQGETKKGETAIHDACEKVHTFRESTEKHWRPVLQRIAMSDKQFQVLTEGEKIRLEKIKYMGTPAKPEDLRAKNFALRGVTVALVESDVVLQRKRRDIIAENIIKLDKSDMDKLMEFMRVDLKVDIGTERSAESFNVKLVKAIRELDGAKLDKLVKFAFATLGAETDHTVKAFRSLFEQYFRTHNITEPSEQEEYITSLTFIITTLAEEKFFEKMGVGKA
ncbi:TolC family protein, partial [Candidatus Omnitrophota bacterium]